MLFLKDFLRNLFQLTPSRRATTQQEFADRLGIFQLTPSRRATSTGGGSNSFEKFQLTPSRRATLLRCSLALLDIFQLTPSRRATDPSGRGSNMSKISTHALTEGDRYRSSSAAGSNISTHALTEGDFSVPGFLRT